MWCALSLETDDHCQCRCDIHLEKLLSSSPLSCDVAAEYALIPPAHHLSHELSTGGISNDDFTISPPSLVLCSHSSFTEIEPCQLFDVRQMISLSASLFPVSCICTLEEAFARPMDLITRPKHPNLHLKSLWCPVSYLNLLQTSSFVTRSVYWSFIVGWNLLVLQWSQRGAVCFGGSLTPQSCHLGVSTTVSQRLLSRTLLLCPKESASMSSDVLLLWFCWGTGCSYLPWLMNMDVQEHLILSVLDDCVMGSGSKWLCWFLSFWGPLFWFGVAEFHVGSYNITQQSELGLLLWLGELFGLPLFIFSLGSTTQDLTSSVFSRRGTRLEDKYRSKSMVTHDNNF